MELNRVGLNKLHVFRVVAESATLREAASKLLRSPSAESQLGLALFGRSGLRLELTPAGRKLLEETRRQEASLARVLDELSEKQDAPTGLVTLGVLPRFPGRSFLRPLAEGLRRGRLNMALSVHPRRFYHRGLESRQLRKEPLCLVTSTRGGPRLARARSSMQLQELPVIDYLQNPSLLRSITETSRPPTILERPNPGLRGHLGTIA